ncbi:MAG: aminotransferase class V-fold PLP-dependent enzyme [Prevotellaceae bacterium]|jgi:cysteine desulfurase|nr:aminotransferase class V-fold PLP-dependent enzyme [Prevotellaceae bacterium]
MIEYLPWSKKLFNKGLKNYTNGQFNVLDIELGGQCNYHCIYCDSPSRNKESIVSISKIEDVLKTNPIKWVFICGLGEPTAGGNLPLLTSILDLCLKYEAKCSCFTNLSVLSPEIENYIKQGVLHLLFKHDSTDLSIINNLYGTKKAVEQAKNIEAIKKLVKIKNGYTNIAASIVPTKKNKNEILSIVKDCINNNIFPLIAELENSGKAQEHYDELALSNEELTDIKTQVNNLIEDEYEIPICPAVICGVHIRYDGMVTVDAKTGLSCHWFWLEEPRTHSIGNFNNLNFSAITANIRKYRKNQIDEVITIYKNRNNLVFGGCGGDVEKILSKYIEVTSKQNLIYLDNNATTQLSDSVIKTIDVAKHLFANPSSQYSIGKEIHNEIQTARKNIANLINADPECLVFTGCASESNNAIFSSCAQLFPDKKHIIISAVEHPSVLNTALSYEKKGYEITCINVDSKGRLNLSELIEAIRNDTLLVSIMTANNETGNIYPIQQIVEKVKEKNPDILVHTDAVQAIGKMEVDVQSSGVDFLSMSGHKFHAPKGIGCIYAKNIEQVKTFIWGGEQENHLRGGTENTISILAMGQAAIETKQNLSTNIAQIKELRDYLEMKLLRTPMHTFTIIGDIENRVCNTSCVSIGGIKGYELVDALDRLDVGVCISAGSACNSTAQEPSIVMKSLGINIIPIRISLSKYTTRQEINDFYKYLLMILNKLKK